MRLESMTDVSVSWRTHAWNAITELSTTYAWIANLLEVVVYLEKLIGGPHVHIHEYVVHSMHCLVHARCIFYRVWNKVFGKRVIRLLCMTHHEDDSLFGNVLSFWSWTKIFKINVVYRSFRHRNCTYLVCLLECGVVASHSIAVEDVWTVHHIHSVQFWRPQLLCRYVKGSSAKFVWTTGQQFSHSIF